MKQKSSAKQGSPSKTLDASSTYQVEGRTFVVQPVFQQTGDTTLAALLMNLMQADASFKYILPASVTLLARRGITDL